MLLIVTSSSFGSTTTPIPPQGARIFSFLMKAMQNCTRPGRQGSMKLYISYEWQDGKTTFGVLVTTLCTANISKPCSFYPPYHASYLATPNAKTRTCLRHCFGHCIWVFTSLVGAGQKWQLDLLPTIENSQVTLTLQLPREAMWWVTLPAWQDCIPTSCGTSLELLQKTVRNSVFSALQIHSISLLLGIGNWITEWLQNHRNWTILKCQHNNMTTYKWTSHGGRVCVRL